MDEKEGSEMQEEMMTVLVVEPMKAPYVKNIPNELEDLQQAVGGVFGQFGFQFLQIFA